MRKILIISCLMLLPVVGTAETVSDAESSGYNMTDIALISAGAVAGMLAVHFLVGEALTVPIASTMSSAAREASAAGAVFGDRIAAATLIKDAKARADMFYVLMLGSGAFWGALALDQVWNWTYNSPTSSSQ